MVKLKPGMYILEKYPSGFEQLCRVVAVREDQYYKREAIGPNAPTDYTPHWVLFDSKIDLILSSFKQQLKELL